MLQALLLRSRRQGLHQALQLVGKLEIPGRLNAVAPGILVYINDQLTGRRFWWIPAQLLASYLISLQSQQQAKAWSGQTAQLSVAGESLQ
jgi:hypothetical protein